MKADGSAPAAKPLSRHPFSWLPDASQRLVLASSVLLTVITMGAIHWTNAPLENPAAPMGIVSLQLAGNMAAAQEILASWGPAEQCWAILNLVIDYPYLLAYATTLGLGCVLIARHLPGPRHVASLGLWLAWGIIGAALLDAVENGALLCLLLGDLRKAWVLLAFWCAVPKYALVLAALAYLVVGGLVILGKAEGLSRG
jgi:hypothetical protein